MTRSRTLLALAILAAGLFAPLAASGAESPQVIAISTGAVFFGAATYIGNGPNFMVKSIAEHAGAKTPSALTTCMVEAGSTLWSSSPTINKSLPCNLCASSTLELLT